MNKYIKCILHPSIIINHFRLRNLDRKVLLLSDEDFIKRKFMIRVGYKCNLNCPKSFNEKLQWMKLYYRNNSYTALVDKYLVREYVGKTIGSEYLVPILGIWDKPEDIDFDILPNQFVLKCNHNSGLGMCICKNKSTLNKEDVVSSLKNGIEEDYFLLSKEWPYKNVKRKIICEKYLGDNNGRGINDYKFYCFNGKVKYFLISSNRMIDVRFDYFDANLKPLPFSQGGPKGHIKINENIPINEMIRLAEILSQNIPHVRVDLYFVNDRIYFGEMTFFDSSGFGKFRPRKWDFIIGDYFVLPEVDKNE